MRESENLSLVHAALTAEGFELDRSETAFLKYAGTLNVAGEISSCEVHIFDENFLALPKLKVLDDRFREHSVAHFENTGYYCYANNGEFVINKYDPRGAVRSSIDMMVDALEHHLGNDLTDEIAREFPQHWFAKDATYTEFKGSGDRAVKLAHVRNDNGKHRLATEICAETSVLGELTKVGRKTLSPARIVELDGNLTFLSGQKQPETLAQLIEWGDSLARGFGDRLLKAFGMHGSEFVETVFIKASNATVGMTLDTPTELSPSLQRKAGINKVLSVTKDRVKIQPLFCNPISLEEMFQRNLPSGKASLADKKIALLGCGTIGSHLCKMLCQNGAGQFGGQLVLIDNQTLQIENIGRHYLGPNRIGQNKALASEKEMFRLFPSAEIKGVAADVLEVLDQLEEFDLIIDATGEEGLSVLVNEWLGGLQKSDSAICGLFVWLYGNADAGQAILVDGSNSACFRCLRPRHGEPARYEPRRDPNSIEITPAACGQSAFVPYGVGGSAAAAGLACTMALDWAGGDPDPRLRTIRINFSATRNMKDVNPKRSPACPYCSGGS